MRQFVVGLKARVHSSSEAELGRTWSGASGNTNDLTDSGVTLTSWVQSPEGTSGPISKVLVGKTHGTLATCQQAKQFYMEREWLANPVKVSQLLQVSPNCRRTRAELYL
jgi:hypothetical protein